MQLRLACNYDKPILTKQPQLDSGGRGEYIAHSLAFIEYLAGTPSR